MMGEKLTRDEMFQDWLRFRPTPGTSATIREFLGELEKRIESDSESIRAEVREECRKEGIITVRMTHGAECLQMDLRRSDSDQTKRELLEDLLSAIEKRITRPPKMRPMTRQERIAAIAKEMGQEYPWMKNANGDTLLDISNWYNIPTEVPE